MFATLCMHFSVQVVDDGSHCKQDLATRRTYTFYMYGLPCDVGPTRPTLARMVIMAVVVSGGGGVDDDDGDD